MAVRQHIAVDSTESAPGQVTGAASTPPSTLSAALARTFTRTLALYFSRPVRLFRPSKVSGWQSLRSLAVTHGVHSITPQYIMWLVKNQGVVVIPKHFIPPIMINAVLGTVLWTTYSESSRMLEPHLPNHPTAVAALSGAVAGGMQAVAAAPAENLRMVLEGGAAGHSWSRAWKEVFRGTQPSDSVTKQQQLQEVREVRGWMREVHDMAGTLGKGWDGWGWGAAKDTCGFAIFFSIFEVTRRVAMRSRHYAQDMVERLSTQDRRQGANRHAPRIVHGVTLVTGGVVAGLAYELAARPFDIARRTVHHSHLVSTSTPSSVFTLLKKKVHEEGFMAFFRGAETASDLHAHSGRLQRNIHSMLRLLARVGPWGVGFLIFEAFGPGLS